MTAFHRAGRAFGTGNIPCFPVALKLIIRRRPRATIMPKEVIKDITQRNVELIAEMEAAFHSRRSFGERIADLVASSVGSWTFLIVQSVFLLIWMILNVLAWWEQWDPYPFILLNLVLSFQSAFATPIILMSQNRQSRISDRRNNLDLQINLLAEQENTEQLRLLRLLCEKVGVDLHGPSHALEETVRPDDIVRQISAAEGVRGEQHEEGQPPK
jgi:uncharacterized membrane protein